MAKLEQTVIFLENLEVAGSVRLPFSDVPVQGTFNDQSTLMCRAKIDVPASSLNVPAGPLMCLWHIGTYKITALCRNVGIGPKS
jgi:hypothetical protein